MGGSGYGPEIVGSGLRETVSFSDREKLKSVIPGLSGGRFSVLLSHWLLDLDLFHGFLFSVLISQNGVKS